MFAHVAGDSISAILLFLVVCGLGLLAGLVFDGAVTNFTVLSLLALALFSFCDTAELTGAAVSSFNWLRYFLK